MKKLALALILCSPTVICAQESPQTGETKAMVCIACHGPQGNSTTPAWPNLAGQNKKYLVKQLNDIKQSKQRNVPTMTAIIANFNEQDMDDLAGYYAKMPLAQGSTPKKYMQRGVAITSF